MAKPTEVEVGEQKAPVIQPGHTFASLTEKIGGIVLKRPIKGGWVLGMFICFMILQWFLLAVCWLFYKGVGVWGVNIPVGWGFAIVNFVWWIGIRPKLGGSYSARWPWDGAIRSATGTATKLLTCC